MIEQNYSYNFDGQDYIAFIVSENGDDAISIPLEEFLEIIDLELTCISIDHKFRSDEDEN